MITMTNDTYKIYIKSSKHPRTINTYKMARCYYDVFYVQGKENAIAKIKELYSNGEIITEVSKGFACRPVTKKELGF